MTALRLALLAAGVAVGSYAAMHLIPRLAWVVIVLCIATGLIE